MVIYQSYEKQCEKNCCGFVSVMPVELCRTEARSGSTI